MRDTDETQHPEAVARMKRAHIRFWAGMVIAAAGLVAVFLLDEVYLGFAVAMAGTGVVPFDKLTELFRR